MLKNEGFGAFYKVCSLGVVRIDGLTLSLMNNSCTMLKLNPLIKTKIIKIKKHTDREYFIHPS